MSCSLFPLSSTFTQSVSPPAFKAQTNQTHRLRVLCNGSPDDHNNHNQHILPETKNPTLSGVDRRNVLIGLGGLYTTSLPSAVAVPIKTPNITTMCQDANSGFTNLGESLKPRKCCPPNIGKKITPFVFPKEKTVRMRWPAHKGTVEQVDKYRRAVQAMRDLPDDHPHSFVSQAKIHCAYCNGGYTQVDNGFPKIEIQIHNSWLFFPFHRWYLYFYERILGKLIKDPTFALPFWNWDLPAGMRIPEMFLPKYTKGKPNPLYDIYRDPNHTKKRLVSLDYDGNDKDIPDMTQIAANLSTVYLDLIRNGGDTLSFFGGVYAAGDSPVGIRDPSVGSVEASCHTAVHRWVGDPTRPNNEDMGNFYSSGYDPLFYVHHTNVDRMWKIWKELGIKGHQEPGHYDWLNASYVFYDENQELVRVYNKDCVKLNKLKYDYIGNPKEELPWLNSRPARRSKILQLDLFQVVETVDQVKFPVPVVKTLKVRVKRPAVRTNKAETNEVLVIKNIKYDSMKFVKFDVFVNDKLKPGEQVTAPSDPEYAGGFAMIPHNNTEEEFTKSMFMLSSVRLGLNELLEDTNTEGEEYAIVTLVPRKGCEDLTIGEIKIELVSIGLE